MIHKKPSIRGILASACLLLPIAAAASAQNLTLQEELGKSIFFDQSLSINNNQACAACHSPETGFTGANSRTLTATVQSTKGR